MTPLPRMIRIAASWVGSMSWLGALAGVVLVWLVGDWFGWRQGGLVVLAAVAGAWIGALHRRIGRHETEWRERLARLEARLQGTAPAVTAATANVPLATPAANEAASAEPAFTPSVEPAVSASVPAMARTEVDESSLPVTTSLGASVLAWFKGGNTIVRIAVVVLFFGVAFLLRYAAEHALLPLELRIAGVALGGLALALVGWRLRESRRGYGLSLQGAGIGIVYLTLFAAMRLYQLVPPGLTFALLALLAAASALLAVRQNALPLALLGFGGGFLAPVLASTGSGNHVALFGFYLVLNLAIAWIARRQSWKLLNLMGVLFTFTIGAAWGVRDYQDADFWTVEPFLIAHVLLYLYIAVTYTRRLVADPAVAALRLPVVDGGLLFGMPIAAFGLQAAMLRDQPLALALSAAALSALYLVVGWRLWRAAGERMLLMVEGLLALGVIFLILVTPLALDARWTGAAWAVQGAGIVWVALRQRRWWAAGVGALLQLGAALAFWAQHDRAPEAWPFANASFVGVLMLALAALLSAHLLRRASMASEGRLARLLHGAHAVLLVLGLLQLVAGATSEAQALGRGWVNGSVAIIAVLIALAPALAHLRTRLQWPELRTAAHALAGLGLLVSLAGATGSELSQAGVWRHYIVGGAWAEVPALLALGVWLLRRDEQPTRFEPVLLSWYAMLHGALFLYTLFAQVAARHHGWTPAAAVALPCIIGLALLHRRALWPVEGRWRAFDLGLLRPLLVLLGLWVAGVNLYATASMAPLPYLPLLNPLDLAHGLIAILAWRWWQASETRSRAVAATFAAAGFWWLNGLLVRSLHHGAGTPMWEQGAWGSSTVQTGFTILWTVTALGATLVATRRGWRTAWMVGAGLLAVVVAKLFFIDLSQVGALARIISFLGVGALMLVIGYLSPLPPAAKEARA
jgi:uncharacterized membrane protein